MMEKNRYFRATCDDYYMPNTQGQGWGATQGQQTQVVKTEENGVRTILRTGIDA